MCVLVPSAYVIFFTTGGFSLQPRPLYIPSIRIPWSVTDHSVVPVAGLSLRKSTNQITTW